jgi:hypothetical protein
VLTGEGKSKRILFEQRRAGAIPRELKKGPGCSLEKEPAILAVTILLLQTGLCRPQNNFLSPFQYLISQKAASLPAMSDVSYRFCHFFSHF